MAHYLVYFPELNAPDDNHLDAVGLDALRVSGLPIHWHAVLQDGPDDGNGMIAAWMRGDPRDADPNRHQAMDWTAAKQDKARNLSAGRFYVGVDPASPVTPHDLELPARFKGHAVTCADGNQWHIPAAARLPHCHGLNEEGQWERRIAKQYEAFATQAVGYGMQIFSELDAFDIARQSLPDLKDTDHAVSFELHDTDVHCCNALMMNYRLTPELIDLFGLLDDMTMIAIISATIDLPEIMDVLRQKKSYNPVGIPVGSPT